MPLCDQRRRSRGLRLSPVGRIYVYLLEVTHPKTRFNPRGARRDGPGYHHWIGIGSGRTVPWDRSDRGPTLHEPPAGYGHSAPNEPEVPSPYVCLALNEPEVPSGYVRLPPDELEMPRGYGQLVPDEPAVSRGYVHWVPTELEALGGYDCWARDGLEALGGYDCWARDEPEALGGCDCWARDEPGVPGGCDCSGPRSGGSRSSLWSQSAGQCSCFADFEGGPKASSAGEHSHGGPMWRSMRALASERMYRDVLRPSESPSERSSNSHQSVATPFDAEQLSYSGAP